MVWVMCQHALITNCFSFSAAGPWDPHSVLLGQRIAAQKRVGGGTILLRVCPALPSSLSAESPMLQSASFVLLNQSPKPGRDRREEDPPPEDQATCI